MDTSVNIKMTPQEHRDVRDAVIDKANVLREGLAAGAYEGKVRQQARETEARLRFILEKL